MKMTTVIITHNASIAEVADKVIIQYGGSVKPENSYDYLTCPDIDGVLVGGASLKPESFEALVSAIMKG